MKHCRSAVRALLIIAGTALGCVALLGSHKPGEFPLRVQLFAYHGTDHYYVAKTGSGGEIGRTLDYEEGDGQGNLFENGQPSGIDFHFHCPDRLRVTNGYETYMTRWKKPGKEVEILVPQIGKPTSTFVCSLKVDVKQDTAYIPRLGGGIETMSAATYKKWMQLVQYDPEHGKDHPTLPSHAIKAASANNVGVAGMEGLGGAAGLAVAPSEPKIIPGVSKQVNISAGIAEGMLLKTVQPQYPPIAKAQHLQGTVVLQAIISKSGEIQDLRVVSGSPMLASAALEAVKQWQYKPYLLNGEPVEVETTINVIFALGDGPAAPSTPPPPPPAQGQP